MAAPTNTVAPSITGTPKARRTLTGSDGTWTGSPTFAYQWQRAEILRLTGEPLTISEILTFDFEDIDGATSSTYLVGHVAVGYMLRLKVTGTNGDGSAIAYAEQVGPVVGALGGGGGSIAVSTYGGGRAAVQSDNSEDE